MVRRRQLVLIKSLDEGSTSFNLKTLFMCLLLNLFLLWWPGRPRIYRYTACGPRLVFRQTYVTAMFYTLTISASHSPPPTHTIWYWYNLHNYTVLNLSGRLKVAQAHTQLCSEKLACLPLEKHIQNYWLHSPLSCFLHSYPVFWQETLL